MISADDVRQAFAARSRRGSEDIRVLGYCLALVKYRAALPSQPREGAQWDAWCIEVGHYVLGLRAARAWNSRDDVDVWLDAMNRATPQSRFTPRRALRAGLIWVANQQEDRPL